MRIDEIPWKESDVVYDAYTSPQLSIFRAKRDTSYARRGNYTIRRPGYGDFDYVGHAKYYCDLDPIAAQAIIYHLLGVTS